MVIRVLVASDKELVRDSISSLLRSHHDIAVVGEVSVGHEVPERYRALHPDVVVMDFSSPSETARALASVNACDPGARSVAIVPEGQEEQIKTVVRCGAMACGSLTWSGEDLLSAVRAVYRGALYYDASVLRSLLEDAGRPPSALQKGCRPEAFLARGVGAGDGNPREQARPAAEASAAEVDRPLTVQEKMALRLLARGWSPAEAAKATKVSETELNTYRRQGMDKLQARNRAQLVRYAMRRGFRFE